MLEEDKNLLIMAILIILGLYFVITNWIILINNLILKRKPLPFVPFIGGMLLFLGLGAVQQPFIRNYAYLVFIIDIGSIPLFLNIIYHFINFLIRKFSGKDR